jgi:hypothetical protein
MASGYWYVYFVKIGYEFAYVGKGCGARYLISAKEKGGIAGIVEFFEKESSALRREKQLIAAYRPRLNKTPGGEGKSYRFKPRRDDRLEARWVREAYQAADSYGNWYRQLIAAAFARCILNEKGIRDIQWPAVVPVQAQGDPEVVEAIRRLNVWKQSTPPASLRLSTC